MMKIILLSAILISVFSGLFAQNVHFGLKGGADLHKIDGSSFKDEYNIGYHVGAFAEIGLPITKIGIQPEVYFSRLNPKTAPDREGIYPFNNSKKIKLSYINIPLLLNLKIVPMISFQVGPQFGILLNKDSSIIQNGKDAFKKRDIGIAGGLQLNLTKFKIYARYVAGLDDVNDTNAGKWHNQAIHVGIGFRIF